MDINLQVRSIFLRTALVLMVGFVMLTVTAGIAVAAYYDKLEQYVDSQTVGMRAWEIEHNHEIRTVPIR